MSDAHNEHQSGIRTPKQLIAAVIAGFLVPILIIVLLVHYVASGDKSGAGSDALLPESVAARIKPVADEGFTLVDANAPKQLLSGEAVYKNTCAVCHDAGVAGAPKTGDAGAWSARLAQGYATVVEHALKGLNAMPAKGGNPDLADVEVERAVVYMANLSGGKFKEPEVKAEVKAEAAAPAESATAAPAAATAPTSAPATASAAPAAEVGKKIYDASCVACHGAGIAGAPKFGDKAAWAPRIAQGMDKLYENSIKGFQGNAGVMPPKGGSSATDEEVKAAVNYIVAASK